MLEFFLILCVGGFAGLMTGIMGASGVMAVVPGMLLLHYSTYQAIGASLAVDMIASLVVSLTYFRNGRVDLGQSIWIAGAAVLGAQAGSHFSLQVPEVSLSFGFGVLLIGSAVYVWRAGLSRDLQKIQNLPFAKLLKQRPILTGLVIGLGAGIYSGLFGAGGGMMFLLALLLLGYSLHQAIGTSTVIMALTTASGTIGHAMIGHLPYLAIGGIATGTVVGSFTSARLANRLDEHRLGKIIALVLGMLGLATLLLPALSA
jgi:uncharacterized membrane protein YfcA